MATNWRRYARFGLYLSLLAILFSVGWYVVQREFDLVLQISLGLIVIGLAVFAGLGIVWLCFRRFYISV